MPLTVYVPSRITEFIDVPVPDAGDDGKALTYDDGSGEFTYEHYLRADENLSWSGNALYVGGPSAGSPAVTNALVVVTGTSSARFDFVAGSTYWYFSANSSNGIWFVKDNTNNRFPFNIEPNPPGNIRIDATDGIQVNSDYLRLAPSTSTYPSLRFQGGANVTSPSDGAMWYLAAGRLQFRRSSTTEVIASGVTAAGGAQTAGGTYGATEQAMLQAVYDASRNFALLT